jgi:hypothetical protein
LVVAESEVRYSFSVDGVLRFPLPVFRCPSRGFVTGLGKAGLRGRAFRRTIVLVEGRRGPSVTDNGKLTMENEER